MLRLFKSDIYPDIWPSQVRIIKIYTNVKFYIYLSIQFLKNLKKGFKKTNFLKIS